MELHIINDMVYSKFLSLLQGAGEISCIGRTASGYKIPLLKKGRGYGGVLLIAGIHAREYVTAYLATELMREYIGDYPVWCLPLLNVDGTLLSTGGIAPSPRQIEINRGSRDFSLWKANGRGVDINVNFDADFGKGRSNVFSPSSESYVGEYPESENETRAVVNLLKTQNFSLVVCYHAKGEEIYYGFNEDVRNRDKAQIIADFLGYELKESRGSCGGIKDFVVKNGGFGITIEVGRDDVPHPYPLCLLPELLKKHSNSVELFCKIATEV